MRFLVMHKLGTVEPSTVPPVPPELVRQMGQLVGELVRKNAMEQGAGLNSRFPRTRISVNGGALVERHGPLEGTNELLARVAMVTVKDKAEAIDVGKRYAKAVGGDITLEVGRVTEAWDIGLVPPPTTAVPEKYLLLHMADAQSEAGTPWSAEQSQRVGALMTELSSSGALTMPLEHVKPSREGRRLKFTGGKRTAIFDGPFAESKELISGFCLVNLPSLEETLAFTDRYGAILENLEVDVLAMAEKSA